MAKTYKFTMVQTRESYGIVKADSLEEAEKKAFQLGQESWRETSRYVSEWETEDKNDP